MTEYEILRIKYSILPRKSHNLTESPPSSANESGGRTERMARVVEEMASKIEETAESCNDVDLAEDWMNPVQGPDRPKLHVILKDREDASGYASRRNSFILQKGDVCFNHALAL